MIYQIRPWHRGIVAEPWPEGAVLLPKWQAHRGCHSKSVQENTFEAFHRARALGFQMCECDVQMSADGVPVIVHDPDLKRIKGINRAVAGLSAKELFELARVPTLESVLGDPDCPDLWNIEIKSDKFWDPLFFGVLRVIKKTRSHQRILLSSFNPFVISYFSKHLSMVPRALLVSAVPSEGNSVWLREMILAPFLRLHMLNLDFRMLNPHVLEFFRDRGIPLSAWTLQDRAQGESLLNSGVRSIIFDDL